MREHEGVEGRTNAHLVSWRQMSDMSHSGFSALLQNRMPSDEVGIRSDVSDVSVICRPLPRQIQSHLNPLCMGWTAVAKRLIGWLGLLRLLNLRRACRPFVRPRPSAFVRPPPVLPFRVLHACLVVSLRPCPPDARLNAHSPARAPARPLSATRFWVDIYATIFGSGGCR